MKELTEYSISELSSFMANKELSSEELTRAYLDSITKHDPDIRAYLSVTEDIAIEKAKEVDQKRLSGETLSILAGIPAAIKDNICTKNVRTTCASKMLENFVPCYHATVIEQLNNHDYVLLGKANMDEFAMGSSTENPVFKSQKIRETQSMFRAEAPAALPLRLPQRKRCMRSVPIPADPSVSLRHSVALSA